MTQDNTMRNATIIGVSFLLSLFVINAIVGPLYNVWAQSLQGKAELQKAEYTRQVAVLEAQAKKDSAQQLADAEVIRAQGEDCPPRLDANLQEYLTQGAEEFAYVYTQSEGWLCYDTCEWHDSYLEGVEIPSGALAC